MRLTAIIAILLSLSILSAMSLEQYQSTASGVSARLSDFRAAPLVEDNSPDNDDGLDTVSYVSKTFALPYESVDIQVNQMSWNVFDQNGTFLYTENNLRDDTVVMSNSFTFREMKGFTVKIRAQFEESGLVRTLNSIDFGLNGQNPIAIPQSVSPAFVDAYKNLADNWDTCYLRYLPIGRPSMLIISHSALEPYQAEYIRWKQQRGFEVYVLNKSNIGETLDQFKAAITAHYNQYQCDYLMLFGDVTGTYSIPTAFYPSPEYQENDADDHQYTLITGDDYFPEMLAGRFSFNNVSELIVMLNKTVSYEKTPMMADTNWMKRAVTIAGNFAEGNLRPTTPIHMSRWLRNRFLDYGYTAVDTVYYPPTYPGTSLIQTSINQGVQFISYRGWGDANGWHYPSFHLADLNNTFNGAKMPIVFSIVCNTGDFANTVNPSFGEKWMRMGTLTSPGGCVAFVGPSDLHTKTRLNNSISSGSFRAILDYGVRSFGASVLNGKIELYKNFPNDLAPNQYVSFYYHVYNLLSDPSLNMWVLVPDQINDSVFVNGLTFAQSDTHIQINAANLDGATITATKDGITYSYAKVEHGIGLIQIDPDQTGDLTVTITRDNMVPLQKVLTPTAAAPLSISNTEFSVTGEQINIATIVENNTEATINNVSVKISFLRPELVNIQTDTVDLGSVTPTGTPEADFNFTLNFGVNPRIPIYFKLQVMQNGIVHSTHIASVTPNNKDLVILNHSGTLNLGANNPVSFQIKNNSNFNINSATLQITSQTNAATVTSPQIELGMFAAWETKNVDINIQVAANTYNGRNIKLHFEVNGTDVYFASPYYSVVAGTPSSSDPTGPCEYGYFAYDSTDLAYSQKPTYNWVGIDPNEGGQGTVWTIQDDGVRVVQLPFTFKYYGIDYDTISICSNGWLSFGETDMFDFYNHYIPAALGPYAMIAGYWDDLKGMKTGVDNEGNGIFNDMRISYWHDAANNRYIVEWNDAYNQYNINAGQDASLEKFQIILYPKNNDDGDIVLQYHTVDNPGTTTNYCTVGIEDHRQLDGLTYTHGNQYPITAATLQAGLAIKFTTVAPDNYVSNDDEVVIPGFRLAQNYPNPFNPTTTISFNADQAGPAKLVISNIKGQVVRTLHDGNVSAGPNRLVWNGLDDAGRNVSSGIYFYRLEMGSRSETRKMLLVK